MSYNRNKYKIVLFRNGERNKVFFSSNNKKSILKQNLPSATDLMMPPYNNLKQKLIDFSIKWF